MRYREIPRTADDQPILYTCTECGSAVTDRARHDGWHTRQRHVEHVANQARTRIRGY